METNLHSFDALIDEALAKSFSGWDFSWLGDRWRNDLLPWDYVRNVVDHLDGVSSLLDVDTGGGEMLLTIAREAGDQFPKTTFATEGYAPNVPVARQTLAQIGVQVIDMSDATSWPFGDNTFDLAINRHGSDRPRELRRVLKPDGISIAQHVGGRHNIRLNELLGGPAPEYLHQDLAWAVAQIQQAGFEVTVQREAFTNAYFADIGAVAFYLKIITWQIPGFDVDSNRPKLRKLHDDIQRSGPLVVQAHHYYIEARNAKGGNTEERRSRETETINV